MSNRSIFRLFSSGGRVQKANLLFKNQLNFKNFKQSNHYLICKNLIKEFNKNHPNPNQVFSIVGIVMAASNTDQEITDLMKKADELYEKHKFDEIITLLDKPELLEKSDKKYEFKWRLARSKFSQIKEKQRSESELDAIRELVLSALEDNPSCGAAHKWAAILIDEAAAKKGIKERIKQLLTVKDHMQKAIQYSPTDPTSLYLLAEWHYSCYNVSWAERQIAKVIFGTLPVPDLEEALTCLKKAEEIEAGFYSKNLVLLAKTLIALKRENDLAKESLKKVLYKFQNSHKWDDVEATEEAKELLKKMGEKF